MSIRPPKTRRAFTFVEIIAAAAMLAVLLALAGQMLVQSKRHTRIVEQRALALRTVENSLEELTARPWDEINGDAITQLTLSEPLARQWPKAKFSGNVEELTEPAPSKRISLQLQLTPNRPALSAKLTTWIYRAPTEPTE